MAQITAVISCLALTANQRERLQERCGAKDAAFVVVNERAGRFLLDFAGQRPDLSWFVERLTELSKDPIVCIAFRAETGRRLRDYPANRAAWRDVAPDVQVGTNPDGSPIFGRPPLNSYRQTHSWLGWPPHDEQDEDQP